MAAVDQSGTASGGRSMRGISSPEKGCVTARQVQKSWARDGRLSAAWAQPMQREMKTKRKRAIPVIMPEALMIAGVIGFFADGESRPIVEVRRAVDPAGCEHDLSRVLVPHLQTAHPGL